MTQILCIYHPVNGVPTPPNFLATDQNPQATRYLVGEYYVDAIGSEPTSDEIQAVLTPPMPLPDLSRPAFLFMMNKIGVSEAQVEALIGQMPETTQAEKDAKALALIVFQNQQTFRRDNPLLETLTAAAGLDSATVDSAWRAAEQLSW